MDDIKLWRLMMHQLRESCAGFDSRWIRRKRVFDTFSVVSSLIDLCVGHEKSHLRAMQEFDDKNLVCPAASSFCEARAKMPSHIISEIRDDLLLSWDDQLPTRNNWFGYTTYIIDGSKINLPRSLLAKNSYISPGGYVPQGLLSVLLRVQDRMVVDLELTDNWNERYEASKLVDKLSSSDVVIYDRGYFSLELLIQHILSGTGAVFRIANGNVPKEIKVLWQLKDADKITNLSLSAPTIRKLTALYPHFDLKSLKLRLIKYQINDVDYMIATTLLEDKIVSSDFIELYAERWLIEEFFKAYKQTIDIEAFHSKAINGVEQELFVTSLLWNITMFMNALVPKAYKKTEAVPKNITLPNEFSTNLASR